MTVVATWGSTRLPSAAVAERETHTPHRNVRVADERWDPFGDAVGKRGRSEWMNEFIGWVIADPQLWHDARRAATTNGETLGGVVAKALRTYVRRHGG